LENPYRGSGLSAAIDSGERTRTRVLIAAPRRNSLFRRTSSRSRGACAAPVAGIVDAGSQRPTGITDPGYKKSAERIYLPALPYGWYFT